MRKMMITIAIATMGLSPIGGLIGQASAEVNVRQFNQERRIDAGRRSGKLTAAEGRKLRNEQRAISRLGVQLRARHGGKLTAADNRLIKERQDAADRHILGQKKDRQRGGDHLKVKVKL